MDRFDEKTEAILRCPTSLTPMEREALKPMIAAALRESAAEAYEDAAKSAWDGDENDPHSARKYLREQFRKKAAALRPQPSQEKP